MSKFQNVVPFGQRHRASLPKKTRFQQSHSRSREPVTRSRMTVRGRFPSFKMGRMIDWESQLERRACYRFEFSPAVLQFREQPESIRLPIDGRLTKYTPDFELQMANGETWLVEIKPFDHLQRPEVSNVLSHASDWYLKHGYRFIVITDEELIEPDLESNLCFLRHFQTHVLSNDSISHALHWLKQSSSPTLGELHDYFGDKVSAFALLCQQLIHTDLSIFLNSRSQLFLNEDKSHAKLLFLYRTAPAFGLCSIHNSEDS